MGDVINLRTARKQRARKQAEQAATTNRTLFGRTRAQKAHDTAEAEKQTRFLDQHRREDAKDEQ